MKVLVVGDCLNSEILPSSFSIVEAAKSIASEIDLLVYGSEFPGTTSSCKSIFFIDEKFNHPTAEFFVSWLYPFIYSREYTHVLFSNSTFGKNVLPRISALFSSLPVTEILSIESEDVYVRPIYAGSLLTRVQLNSDIKFLGVRSSCFKSKLTNDSNSSDETFDSIPQGGESELLSALLETAGKSKFIEYIKSDTERPRLEEAKVIVSGGKALGESFFSLLDPLAEKLGAAIGASRAVVDEGFAPNELQIGQTGKTVSPDLYVCFGISGAAQHLAGIKDARIIIAVNKDPDAPINSFADFHLVADLFEVIPMLQKSL